LDLHPTSANQDYVDPQPNSNNDLEVVHLLPGYRHTPYGDPLARF
jgi:hypothetical protein